ncbi:MAG: hypothetical protein ACOC2H_07825 [Spirochaetota bacterium]
MKRKLSVVLGVVVFLCAAVSCSTSLMTSTVTVGKTTTLTVYGTTKEAAMTDLQSEIRQKRAKFGTPGQIYCAKGVKKKGSIMPDLWSCTVKMVK